MVKVTVTNVYVEEGLQGIQVDSIELKQFVAESIDCAQCVWAVNNRDTENQRVMSSKSQGAEGLHRDMKPQRALTSPDHPH